MTGTAGAPPPATPPATAPGSAPNVAAFDFDGTLIEGGSVLPFLVSIRGPWAVARAVLRRSPQLLRAAVAGGTTADEVKEALFVRLLGTLPAADVDRRSAVFAQRHLRRKLRAQVAQRLRWHQARGHHVVIVSASPESYVGPAGDRLGVDAVVATRLAVGADGNLTGGYDGRNCRGAEKVARLQSHLEAQGLMGDGAGPPLLWAYGNSRGDLALLGAADHGVDAGKLGRWGALRHFPRLAQVSRESAGPRG